MPRARAGTLSGLKALVLVDMIAERSPRFMRESQLDAVADRHHLVDGAEDWATARSSSNASTPIEDDHIPFLNAGVPATDIIDLDYPAWHTAADTLDQTSARSLQIVGDVVVASLAPIEARARRDKESLLDLPNLLFNLPKEHHHDRDQHEDGEDRVNDQRPSAFFVATYGL